MLFVVTSHFKLAMRYPDPSSLLSLIIFPWQLVVKLPLRVAIVLDMQTVYLFMCGASGIGVTDGTLIEVSHKLAECYFCKLLLVEEF